LFLGWVKSREKRKKKKKIKATKSNKSKIKQEIIELANGVEFGSIQQQ
jgi:hypothetical protein